MRGKPNQEGVKQLCSKKCNDDYTTATHDYVKADRVFPEDQRIEILTNDHLRAKDDK